jgi:hypothetical protein
MLGRVLYTKFRQRHGGLIVPEPKVRAIVVLLAVNRRDIPIVAGNLRKALPAEFVQVAIVGNQFYVHLPDS